MTAAAALDALRDLDRAARGHADILGAANRTPKSADTADAAAASWNVYREHLGRLTVAIAHTARHERAVTRVLQLLDEQDADGEETSAVREVIDRALRAS